MAVSRPSASGRTRRLIRRPLDRDARLLADRPAVVARRNLEDVARAELHPFSGGQLDAPPTRNGHAHMAGVAPFPTELRTRMLRPPPTRLERLTRHDVATDAHDLVEQHRQLV